MAEGAKSNRPHPVLVAFAVMGILAFLSVGAALALAFFALRSVPSFTSPVDNEYLSPLKFEKAIAGIRMEGEINNETSRVVLEKLEEASRDSRVVGILFEVNSPGGSVVPSQEIYDAIKVIREKKPVVTYVHDVAASGAYYASASSSSIYANRGSLIGSIGVIMAGMESTELIKFLKLRPITLKTGKLKDAGSPIREWTEEDVTYLQNLIEDTRNQFVADVKAGRQLEESTVSYMSDGRVVLGTEAVQLKLIDNLGRKEDALKEISTLAGHTDTPKLIYLELPQDFKLILSDFIQGMEELGNLSNVIRGASSTVPVIETR